MQFITKKGHSPRMITLSLVFLILMAVYAILGPWLSDYTYSDTLLSKANHPPSREFWMGTDELGRDLFTRIAFGARISLCVGLLAAFIDLLIGVIWGGIAAMAGGWVDDLMMRAADTLYSLPYMLLVTLLLLVLGPSLLTIILAMSLISWIPMARIVRSQLLGLKNREFILAAQGWGAGRLYLLFYHLLPNAWGPVLVTLTLTIPSAIFVEAFLSFLGLGVQAPFASWGTLASDGLQAFEYYPWRFFLPASFISGTLLAFNLLGEGLRHHLDVTS